MADDNYDNDVLIRRRVDELLSNPNAKFPYIYNSNSDEIKTIACLLANTGESMDSPEVLDGHEKWYWVTNKTITKLYLGCYLNLTSNTWRLSTKIGSMIGMEHLYLCKCSSIPPEIAKLESLKQLDLAYCDDQIDLPQVEMPALNTFCINYGVWDKARITALLSWLSVYVPKLTTLVILHLSRDVAKLFINALVEMDSLNRINLKVLQFSNCGLVEEDTSTITFDLLPLYPTIDHLFLDRNKIESLKTIGEAATKIEDSISSISNLKNICLAGNPCFTNLKTPTSPDHIAVISLLKHFKQLSWLGHSKETIRPTTEIEYWTKINRGGRFLVDGRYNVDGKMLPENLWPKVLELAYRKSNGGPHAVNFSGVEDDPTHDATAMFYLIRNGPLFSEERKVPAVASKKRKRVNH
jgi:hypothetical protein